MGKLLMTGAAGGVGTMLRPMLQKLYGDILLSDRAKLENLSEGKSFRPCDLADKSQVDEMLRGVDRVIHLGGQSLEADWDVILQANIIGLYNLYEGCRQAGVKRVVFASSNHTIGFYGRNRRIDIENRVRPDSRYGISKVFGEGVAALYADKHGIGTLSVRIGNIGLEPVDTRRLSIWLHPQDFLQLCRIGLEHPDIHNQVVWGVSDCDRAWWDNAVAFGLGYRPQHRAEDFAATAIRGDGAPDPVADRFQGADFCSEEFDADVQKALNS